MLKRLDDARRDGDRIYAVIRSMGTSSDGKGQAVYAPSAAGQVEGAAPGVRRWRGSRPATIELVEAHGTGTKVGDAIELAALERGLPARRGPRATWCALGSVKSQIGHTKAAAGAAGLIKAALALHHKVLPPTIKVDAADRGAGAGRLAVLPQHRGPPLAAAARAIPAARRSAPSASAAATSTACSRRPTRRCRAIDWGGDVQILAFSGRDAAEVEAALPRWTDDVPWTAVRDEAARAAGGSVADDPSRLVLVAERGKTEPAG